MISGLAKDGHPATVVTLTNTNGVTVSFMDIGATWLSCVLPLKNKEKEVLLGVSTMADFYRQSAYFGTTVGRYANRIANGQFSLNGDVVQLKTNHVGNTLHGGPDGFDQRRWRVVYQTHNDVVFELDSPDGDQGFPGHLTVTTRYVLTDENEVQIEYEATTDAPTPIGLTNHVYFNLSDDETVLQHNIQILAKQYLPINETGIPLGELTDVEGSHFDFRDTKLLTDGFLDDQQQRSAKGYDHAFLLDEHRDQLKACAIAQSPDHAISLYVATSQPAMQLYTGNWLGGNPKREGGEYADYAGFALESEMLPNSPNHPEWPQPSCFLEPEETYRHFTRYRFEF